MIKITKKEEYENGKRTFVRWTLDDTGSYHEIHINSLEDLQALKIELDKALAQEQ